MGFWQRYLSFPVIYKIAIGFILGIIAGLLIGPPITVIKPLGDFFIRLLKMIVMPLVFFTLTLGAATIEPRKLGKAGGLVIIIYIITSFIAVSIGLSIGLAVHPGIGFTLPGVTFKPPKPVSFIDVVLSWIPTNPFGALAEGKVIPTIIFALIVGLALAFLRASEIPRVREAAEVTYRVFDALSEVMYKVVRFILEVAPYGVFALIAVVIGKTGIAIFVPYAKLIGSEALAIALQIGVVYSMILLIAGINPVKFFRAASEAMFTAFVTRSSSGTLPVTMRVADEKLGIDRGLYAFTLPLGATINMDGTAIYEGVVAIFAADIVGRMLTGGELATLAVAAVMASVGTAGIPGAGLIMLTGH